MTHFRDLLPLPDRLRYFIWILSRRKGNFRCRLRNRLRLSLRALPHRDYEMAWEIFFLRIYDASWLDRQGVHYIVDLGANIGYSCLLWCVTYPNAKVFAFEPHPRHCESIRFNLRENGYSERVTLVEAGVAVDDGRATLTDAGVASSLVAGNGSPAADVPVVNVKVVDFFKAVGERPIDILKIDIEGSEYALMQDRRFAAVAGRTRYIMIEWHSTQPHHLGAEWCRDKLASLGFDVKASRTQSDKSFGVFHATRVAR